MKSAIEWIINFIEIFVYEYDLKLRLLDINGLLTLSLVILTLCGVISWSWVWVLSPLWIAIVVLVICDIVMWR